MPTTQKHYLALTAGLLLLSVFSLHSYACLQAKLAKTLRPQTYSLSLSGKLPQSLPQTVPLLTYTKERPASLQPVLTWEKFLGAVAYEIEIQYGSAAPKKQVLYVNGYNFHLPSDFAEQFFTWRVRALNLDRQPMSAFCAWQTVPVNTSLPVIDKPIPTTKFNQQKGANLLYPVYNWLPVDGIQYYEVEILRALPPDNKTVATADILVERGHTTGSEWYDDEKHITSKPLYWRVRGITKDGHPLTDFSDPEPFYANPGKHYQIATLGDSITHGGGSLSYSPSDWEYDYQSYLEFDSINLGQSGDTSAATLARFEEDVLPFHPQYLLIMTGSNSLRGWISADSVINDLQQIKQKCLANQIKPVFITLPPINPTNIQKAFRESTADNWQQEFAAVNAWTRQQVHIDLGPYFDETKPLPTDMALDGIHLDVAGKKLMAQAINEQLPRIMRYS